MQDNRKRSAGEEKQCARESLILQMMKAILCLLQDSNAHTNRAYKFILHTSEVSVKHAEVFVETSLISSAVIKYI